MASVHLPYISPSLHQYLSNLQNNRYGSPYIELTDSSHIIGGGFISTIEYKGKGYFTGKSHTFKATHTAIPGLGGSSKEHTIEGLWHEKSKFTKGPSSDIDFYDVASTHKNEVTIVGGQKDGSQGTFETRKLWNLVAKGIKEGDYELASKEKSRIENEQRQMRKDEAAAETKWELKHFKHEESDPLCESRPFVWILFRSHTDNVFFFAVTDERLGKFAKLSPPEEDFYPFLGNWPDSLAN